MWVKGRKKGEESEEEKKKKNKKGRSAMGKCYSYMCVYAPIIVTKNER